MGKTTKEASLSSMTVDSIPISKLGQRGAGFLAAHGAVTLSKLTQR